MEADKHVNGHTTTIGFAIIRLHVSAAGNNKHVYSRINKDVLLQLYLYTNVVSLLQKVFSATVKISFQRRFLCLPLSWCASMFVSVNRKKL